MLEPLASVQEESFRIREQRVLKAKFEKLKLVLYENVKLKLVLYENVSKRQQRPYCI